MVQKARKSNVLRTIFISVTLLIDGVITAGLGYVYFICMAMLDPVDFDVETKYANIRQGEMIYYAALVFLLVFILAALLWWLGKRIGKYVAAVLCIVGLLLSIPILAISSIFHFYPLLIVVLALIGLNVFSLIFIFAKDRQAIPQAAPGSDSSSLDPKEDLPSGELDQ